MPDLAAPGRRRFALAALVAWAAASTAQAAIPQAERDALIALYNSTDGAHWKNRSNWRNGGDTDFNAPGSECSWHGVTCDSAKAHVTKVNLADNQLNGTIPNLSGLHQLQHFDVSVNQLSGTIPNLSGLHQLQHFDVSINQLSGTIPNLSGLHQLQRFDARVNQLSGTIPNLSGLNQLQRFKVGVNQLSGTIPDLSGLHQLQHFDVSVNQLSGTIPNLSGLNQLKAFQVGDNLLTGKPPAAPTGLLPSESWLCPNKLEAPSPTDDAWNAATTGNWSDGCSTTAHTVTAQAGPNGSVDPATQQRVRGARAWLAVTPAAGYEFDQATPAPSCGPVTITMRDNTNLVVEPIEADCEIQVSFRRILPGHHSITATANPAAGGSITCTPNPVPHGGNSTCTASANTGYVFNVFNGDCNGKTCTLTNVTAPLSVVAHFTQAVPILPLRAITATANPAMGGSVTCTPNPVPHGGNSTCTATANSGYVFDGFSGDCNGSTCTLTNVTALKTVTANFRATTPATHAITATANPSVGGTVTCTPNPVPNGGNATCTATPAAGYAFDGFGGDCSGNACSLTNVTAPKAVTARFRLIAAAPGSATAVPTLGHWALLLLGLLTAALGLQRLRRS
ncbi:IPTL-CTERM sorting domain-containing protein [Vandammella animalimorsus]|nr:IPTL-CTERM sorting domain-containing protein [Vandammella animalimorsus]